MTLSLFFYFFICYVVSQNCVSDANGCNCPTTGSCCSSDVNICNQNYNQCVNQNPLIALNKTQGCPCVQAYSACFAKLICLATAQQNVRTNCDLLITEYITSGACPSSDLSCIFAPLPTLPSVNCAQQTQCSDCSFSSNCKWCNQNRAGLCAVLSGTCTRVTPSDTVSNIYPFSGGICDISDNDILLAIQNANPPMIQQMSAVFGSDSTLSAAGVQLSGLGNFMVNPTTLYLRFDITTTSAVSNTQTFCNVARDISTKLLGVVDTGRIFCNVTGNYVVQNYITDTGAAPNFGPGPNNGGGGSSLHPIAIAGIVVFVIGIIFIIIALIVIIILKNKNDAERV